jgi:hypothetical protein
MRESNTIDRGILPDEEPIGTTLARTCIGCGSDYEWTSREGFQWPTSYCTRSCKRKSSPKRRTKLDSPDEAPDAGMILLICGRCEEPFGWTPRAEATGTLLGPTYCSQTCQSAAHNKRKKDRKRAVAETVEDRERTNRIMAESDAARELMLMGGKCSACGKVANPTKAAAKDAKRAIEQRSGRTNEVRYYQCDDGWWHWTRMGADLETWRAERMMTTSPASLRHRGRGGWTVPQ